MADSPPSLPTTRKQGSFPSPPLQIRDNSPRMSELRRSLFSPSLQSPTIRTPTFKNQKSMLFLAYVFTFFFVTCAVFFVFNNPSINHSFKKVLNSRRSHISTIFSHYFPSHHQNSTVYSLPFTNDSSISGNASIAISPSQRNDSENGLQSSEKNDQFSGNEGSKREEEETQKVNLLSNAEKNDQFLKNEGKSSNKTEDEDTQRVNLSSNSEKNERKKEDWWEVMSHCDVYDGMWMKDDANPLYQPGSCPFIDEPFDCYQNGRPDNGYQKFRWQPKHCNIPR